MTRNLVLKLKTLQKHLLISIFSLIFIVLHFIKFTYLAFIGMIVQGGYVDIGIFDANINEQEAYNITFPSLLKGPIGVQRCSVIIKRTRPIWWASKHGITVMNVKDLIACQA